MLPAESSARKMQAKSKIFFWANNPILAYFLKGKLADFGFFNFFQKMIKIVWAYAECSTN